MTADQPAPQRRSRSRRIFRHVATIVGLLVLARLAWFGFQIATGGGPPTVGRDTTYVTGPLRPDGTVDYLAALNELYAQGVTRENNAAVPLMEISGYLQCDQRIKRDEQRKPENRKSCLRLLEALDIQLSPQGQRLQPLEWFLVENGQLATERPWQYLDRLYNAPWSAKQFPHADKAMRANDAPLDRLVEATRRPRYYVPRYTDPPDGLVNGALLPDMDSAQYAARYLVARGMQRISQGNSQGAAEDFLACHRLGCLIAQDATLIGHLVGVSISEYACQGDIALAHYGGLSAAALSEYRQALQKLPRFTPATEKIVSDRFMTLDALTVIVAKGMIPEAQTGPTNPWGQFVMRLYDLDLILRIANTAYDELEVAVAAPTFTERKERVDRVLHKWTDRTPGKGWPRSVKYMLIGDRYGISVEMAERSIALFIPAYSLVMDSDRRLQQRSVLVDVALAAAAYRAEHGTYPAKLEDLSDSALETAPAGLFDDGMPKYERTQEGFVLRADNQGKDIEGNPVDRAVVIEVPIPNAE